MFYLIIMKEGICKEAYKQAIVFLIIFQVQCVYYKLLQNNLGDFYSQDRLFLAACRCSSWCLAEQLTSLQQTRHTNPLSGHEPHSLLQPAQLGLNC